MRVFLAPAEISGICARLKIGLRELGHSATFIAPAGRNVAFDYGEIDDPIPAPLAQLFQDERNRQSQWLDFEATKGPFFERVLEFLLHKFWLVRNIFRFVRFAREYDAFVFQYCNSLNLRSYLVKFNDLFWLRLLGKALAVFAAEAACLGRPAVVGGYLSKEELAAAYKYYGVPPSEFCHPSEMKDAIRKLIVDVEYRRRLGEEARKYVTTYWSPKAVAERYLRILNGDAPSDWFWDPKQLDKAVPMCISAERSGELISDIVEKFGESSLFLEDKPALKASALKLMREFRENEKKRISGENKANHILSDEQQRQSASQCDAPNLVTERATL